jgi:ABC-2 type transport system ATP-binding protein
MVGDTVFLVRKVSKRYGSRQILSDISFDVARGEILGLIGASGAGKTTLLHMLVGFVPSSSGDILFHAYTPKGVVECNVLNHQEIVNRSYGFASQHPSFYEKLTVLENLEYFGTMYNLSKDAISRNAELLLKLMELKASAHIPAEHLSGGMKRRLDIACALIHNPPVLILDEPTADLDPMLRSQIWEVLKRINERGTTIILSSHHLNELDTLCSRIAILKDGMLVDIDTPERLKSKYSRTQEVIIESFPGNYDEIIRRLRAQRISAIVREGTYLTVKTENPEHIISELLSILHRTGESLLDIKLIKPNLDNVFVTIYRKAAHQKTLQEAQQDTWPHAGQEAHAAQPEIHAPAAPSAHPAPLDKAHSLAGKEHGPASNATAKEQAASKDRTSIQQSAAKGERK